MQLRLTHEDCELCGADEPVEVASVAVSEVCRRVAEHCGASLEPARVVRCAECGFFYASPMPHFDREATQELYSGDYFGEYTQRWRHSRMVANPERRLDAIERAARGGVSRFLEVGCGEGFAMRRAALRGWQVAGQKVSEEFAARARRGLDCHVFVGELRDAPWPEGSFDVVYADSVVEHVSQPVEMLRQMAALVRPGGVVYVVCPNEECLLNSAKSLAKRTGLRRRAGILSPLSPPYHVVGSGRATISRALRQAGLRPVEVAVGSGADELSKYVPASLRARLWGVALHPLYVLGEWVGRGTTLEATAVKEPPAAARWP